MCPKWSVRWLTAWCCCIYCAEAATASEKSAVWSWYRVSSLCELLRRETLLLQCACASFWAQSSCEESWATQLAVLCLSAQVSTYTSTHISHTHPPCHLSHCPSASVRLKTVDVLMRSLQAAERQVKKYEGRLSEEDIVPADTTAIQALREQIRVSHTNMKKRSPGGSLFSGSPSHVHNCNSLYMGLSGNLFICSLFKMIWEELLSLCWNPVQSS